MMGMGRVGRLFTCAGIGVVVFSVACACGPIPDYRTLANMDLRPPVFLGIETRDARTVLLRFDERVAALPKSIAVSPEMPIEKIEAAGSTIIVTLGADQKVGSEYTIEAAAEDLRKNSTTLLTHFYGYNPSVPAVLINEFISRGSGSHPDLVELYVKSDGNMAGVCACNGTTDFFQERFIFPSIEVKAGDYILLHWKPQGVPEEINETADKAASGGLDASPQAFDEWVPRGTGLGSNSGVISLYASPGGSLIDAVLFCNRTSQSDESYTGFGSKEMLQQATQLVEEGGWKTKAEAVAPEDAVNPDGTTSTRSLCRSSLSADTDAASDWHIVPTRKATFGSINSDEVYVP